MGRDGTRARPAPLADIPASLCRRVSHLFVDIDDTLTDDGLLPDASYFSLWDCARAGIRVVPVTGRPAGWCDHIARMWPVAGVVGENGAFYYAYDRAARRMIRRYAVPQEELAAGRDRLARIAQHVLREVPGTAVAADQAFRISDFAIDFREDVPPLPDETIDDICALLSREEGVRFKISSIHVNYWLGDFDKLSCVRLFLRERSSAGRQGGAGDGSTRDIEEESIFVGDSPNDEPLFAGLPHTIAVGNLRRFFGRISHMPEYIAQEESARGFCEAARTILAKRRAAAS